MTSDDPQMTLGGATATQATVGAVTRTPGEPTSSTLLAPGQTVGRYVVLERAGAGAYGVVYAAYDPQLDRRVALKLMALARGETDERLREARALGRLSHPNVVTIHDVGEIGGSVFLAMEFVAGRTLRDLLAGARAGDAEILRAFIDAGRGLQAAHQLGIVHGDFKPANVMIGADGRARVLDFGLATMQGGADETTAASRVAGTPAYMAPELFSGAPTSVASDVFAFCVALHEAYAGTRPFGGTTAAELAYAILHAEPAPLPRRVPARIRRIIRAGLARDPAVRPPTLAAVLAALQPPRARTGLIAVGSAAVTAIVMLRASSFVPDPCADAGAAVAAVFDDAARERLRQHIDAADDPDLTHMTPAIETRLDRAVERTRDQLDEVCAAEHKPPDERPPRLVERRRCLDVRVATLTRLVDALQRADGVHLGLAIGVSENALRDTDCTDASDPLLVTPAGDAGAVRIADALLELSWAKGEARAGYSQEAMRRVEAAREAYADLPLVLPRFGLMLGRDLTPLEDLDRANAEVRAAMLEALRRGDLVTGLRAVAAAILLSVERNSGTGGRRDETARGLLELADALRQGQGTISGLELELALADVSLSTFELDYDAAERALARASAAADPERAVDAAMLAQGRAVLAFNQQQMREAWHAGAEAAALQRFLHGNHYPLAGLADRTSAVVLVRVGEFERGRALLEQIVASLLQRYAPDSRAVVTAMFNLCPARRDTGDFDGAAQCYAQVGRSAARFGGHRTAAASWRGLASAWVLAGNDVAAMLMYQRAEIDERDLDRRLLSAADLADLWRRHGLPGLAADRLRRVLADLPAAVAQPRRYAQVALVDALIDRGDVAAASEIVDGAVAEGGFYDHVFTAQRGRIRALRGDLTGARDDLESAMADFEHGVISDIGWAGPTAFALAQVRATIRADDPAAREAAEVALAMYRKAPGFAADATRVEQFVATLPAATTAARAQ
ncbi:MAG: serine/threonine protein kinase [Nannocystaceae bacterium]|nr:serine/threonine protein kinase [Nannocystaceae bacterium]